MGLEDSLYNELYDLRERLRNEHQYSNGRMPNVCSDDALREMAQRIPTKLDDFTAIEGVGQKFVEQYGEDFLAVTRKYAVTAAKGARIDRGLAQTLRELQKKLVNINKGNRLLYQPKTGQKNSYDLLNTVPGKDVLDLIFGSKRLLRVCETSRGKDNEKAYRRLSNILREVSRDQRERGVFDLYIAYPFAEGRLAGEDDFYIRAPLALFPVTMEKDGGVFKVKPDDSRDAVYNSTLILAAMKSVRRNREMPDSTIDTYEKETFIPDLLTFYGDFGLPLEVPKGKAEPVQFREYKSDEFPRYSPGELHLTYSAVLGKYPSYSNFIQRDFDTLLGGNEINHTLSDLIRDPDCGDYYSEYPMPLSDEELKEKGMEASEKDLVYINHLNSAQENVLTAISKEDEIVVQGPPGTGKSQVITGLISAAVIKGKTVLMVSEKKTALDVVYSRMGTLSKYCMQIDDTADKDRFYRQLGIMLNIPPLAKSTDTDAIADLIDADVGKLTGIAREIYEPGSFGIAPVELYAMDRWLDSGDRGQFETYRRYQNAVSPSLLTIGYSDVKNLHRKFSDPVLVRNYSEYSEIAEKSPWMTILKQDLNPYQITEMKTDLERLDGEVADLNRKGFLSRLFSKGKVTRDATAVVNKYFKNYNGKTIENVMGDPMAVADAMDDYEKYASRATVYRALTPEEKEYGKDLLYLGKDLNSPCSTVNDGILRYILEDHLQKFDATHREILQELHDFDSIIADMDAKMARKREMTRQVLESTLSNDLRYITESKRRGDIARIVDNKRKWSLNKFINRYGYELFKGIRIWLLTPEVVSEIIPMEMGLFDLLVFDEASQMYVERGIPSIYRAKKVVVAGDHKQLRPSSLGTGRVTYDSDEDELEDSDFEIGAALEEESLLDLARSRYDSILLNFHYRSKYEELIAFSNYAFYGGRLFVSPNIAKPERPPIEVFRTDGIWQDRCNSAEADRAVELLKKFFAERKNRETIGIITFNVSQRDLISDRIDDECARDPVFAAAVAEESRRFDNGEDVGLFVKNIESVQGDERDVIMFSVGYARNSEGRFMQRFGWLNARGGENRLNVAISRAKKKIAIVCSFEPEDLQVENLKSEGPRILKKYLTYARAVSDGNEDLAQSILQSFVGDDGGRFSEKSADLPVMDRVYGALVRKGYNVSRDVGIGGYTIDLAVRQGDRYILGIECDSRIYGISGNTRERDYHRQKYLESRGWHIHRVWTPGMWKDPDAEIAKIVAAIEKSQSA